MRTRLTTALIATLVLTGCAGLRDSRANPANWFGRDAPAPNEAAPETNTLIPGESRGLFGTARERALAEAKNRTSPIATVSSARLDSVPGGAILRVTGLDATQGAFAVALVPANEEELPEDGVLSYSLERQLPVAPQAVGPEQTREVTVGRALTDQQLAGVRSIRITAAQNAISLRR